MKFTIAIIALLGAVGLDAAKHAQDNEVIGRIPSSDDSNACSSCKCGFKQHQLLRIVSGQVAEDAYTWLVAFSYNGQIFCGGSIINSKYVLTAAHCTTSYRPLEEIEVQILRFSPSDKDETYNTRKIAEVIRHENYVKKTNENDIALCRLSEEIDFSLSFTVSRKGIARHFTIRPICMPPENSDFVGQDAIAMGWGRVDNNASFIYSDVLKQVTLPIVSRETCQEKYAKLNNITVNMICAGNEREEAGHCVGDSGGPLIVRAYSNERYIQTGIISYALGCGRIGWYGVSTRVSQYRDWIKEKATGGCYCEDPNAL